MDVGRAAQALPPTPVRPGAETGPTTISVAVWATDISRIDSANQTFAASLFIRLSWQDSRLAHGGAGVVSYALDDIWHPEWIVANDDGGSKQSLPRRVDVTADGTVVYRQRFSGEFSEPLDLRDFPFDQHRFRARFVVLGLRPEDVKFVPEAALVAAGLPQGAGIADDVTLTDWSLSSTGARTQAYRVAPGLELAGYSFEFQAKRQAQYYVVKVILPLLLIVMMSWTVFWIDPSNSGPQISVSVTSMLTLIAYRFAVGAEVPKLPYLTRLDAFILASSILVFVVLIEVIVTTRIATDRLPLARVIDRRSRVIFPAIFILGTALIFLH